MKLLDAQTMQLADRRASETLGTATLMRRAGNVLAEFVRKLKPLGPIIVFAGPGNNGGDAFAICAELGSEFPLTLYAAESSSTSESRSDAIARAKKAGILSHPLPKSVSDAQAAIGNAELIIDGILGVGARNDTTPFAALLQAIVQSNARVVAIDLPTGISANNGEPATPLALKATHTLMLGFPKSGAFLQPAREYCGEIWFSDIGLESYTNNDSLKNAWNILTPGEAFALLPKRSSSADKRSSGAPLLLVGSSDYTGAAVLCAKGAARMGAGYVTVATPHDAKPILQHHLIEEVVLGFPQDKPTEAIAAILKRSEHCSSIAIGPGLPITDSIREIICGILAKTQLPLVIDASALRILKNDLELLRNRICVLTPHAGEFAILSQASSSSSEDRLDQVKDFVRTHGVTTLLKGNPTYIVDASSIHLNPTGTNALATAGTGDVLTGMIATLLSQGCSAVDAARLGAYIHGLSGQFAQDIIRRGVISGDLHHYLPQVWQRLEETEQTPSAGLQRLDR